MSASGRERLLLVSRDRAVELAAPEAGETSSLELFSHSTGEHVVLPFGPPEDGGWSEHDGGRRGPVLKFRVPQPGRGKENKLAAATAAGVVQLVHRLGRHLEVLGNAVFLAVAILSTALAFSGGWIRFAGPEDATTARAVATFWAMFVGWISYFTRGVNLRDGLINLACVLTGVGIGLAAGAATHALTPELGPAALTAVVFGVAVVVLSLRHIPVFNNLLGFFLGVVAYFASEQAPSWIAFTELGLAAAVGTGAAWIAVVLQRRAAARA